MKIDEYPEVVRNGWAMHESYRRMGFSRDVIFFEVCVDSPPFPSQKLKPLSFIAIVRAQGKEFRVNAGLLGDIEPDKLSKLWTQFALDLPSFAEADLDIAYEAAMARMGGRAGLVLAMLNKGFYFPRGSN